MNNNYGGMNIIWGRFYNPPETYPHVMIHHFNDKLIADAGLPNFFDFLQKSVKKMIMYIIHLDIQ